MEQTLVNSQEEQLETALIALDEAWSQLSRQISADSKEYPFSVPPGQIYLLRLLDRVGAQRMSDLADQMGITQGGCTTLVDRAVEAGLVERQRGSADRRVVRVVLSAEGNRTLDEIRRVRARILATYLNRLQPQEVETLAKLLGRVAAVAMGEPQSHTSKAVGQA